MSLHIPVNKKGIYFITFTCHRWHALIEKTNCYDSIYKWFDILKKKNHEVLAYVIMPNHLHLLLYYSGSNRTLNFEIGEAKRFIAYEIINRLKKSGEQNLLKELRFDVQMKDKSRGDCTKYGKIRLIVKNAELKALSCRNYSIYIIIH